jgi:hypothetical protein
LGLGDRAGADVGGDQQAGEDGQQEELPQLSTLDIGESSALDLDIGESSALDLDIGESSALDLDIGESSALDDITQAVDLDAGLGQPRKGLLDRVPFAGQLAHDPAHLVLDVGPPDVGQYVELTHEAAHEGLFDEVLRERELDPQVRRHGSKHDHQPAARPDP